MAKSFVFLCCLLATGLPGVLGYPIITLHQRLSAFTRTVSMVWLKEIKRERHCPGSPGSRLAASAVSELLQAAGTHHCLPILEAASPGLACDGDSPLLIGILMWYKGGGSSLVYYLHFTCNAGNGSQGLMHARKYLAIEPQAQTEGF